MQRLIRILGLLGSLSGAAHAMAETSPCAPPDTAQPLTLVAAMRHALCANPETREAWANLEAGEAGVDEARAAYRPSLSLDADITQSGDTLLPDDDNISGVTLGLAWLLFDGGARDGARDAAAAARAAALAARDAAAQRVYAQAAQAWLRAGSTQAALEAARASEAQAESASAAARARRAAGAAALGDALQAKAALAQARLARVLAEGEADIARGALARALGASAATPFRLAEMSAARMASPPELRAVLESARVRRPDLAEAAARVTEAEADTRRLAAGNRPRLSISAAEELQRADDQGDAAGRLSLTLSWPFYDGGAVRAQTRAARARAESAAARGDDLGLEAELEVWRAFHRLETEDAAIEHAREALAASEHAERAQLARYKAGLSDIVALLAAQTTLAEARRQEIQARYSYQAARVELARAAGHLDPEQFQQGSP